MRKSFAWLGGAGLLVLGCGDDSSVMPMDESSSGEVATTTGMQVTTAPMMDTTTTGMVDSTDGDSSSSGADATTMVAESSGGPVCGNDVIEDGEACDGTDLAGQDCAMQGFDLGELACLADCSGYDLRGCNSINCGDNLAQGKKEVCDGTDFAGATCASEGFDGGTLSCELNCGALDTSGCNVCGNFIVEGDEVCDDFLLLGQSCETQGFSSGELGCMADCLSYDTANCITCGNDVIDGVEPCDGADLGGADCVSEGYVGGTLACDPDCALDISGCNTCGNAAVDPGEGCDGANLNGQDCASLGLIGGTLSCSPACQYDFTACDIPGTPFGSDSGYTGYVIQGAPLPCDNIVGTGIPTLLGDDTNLTVPVGFDLTFYGVAYNQANVQSNGAINFGTVTEMSLSNSCLPTNTAPNTNNLYVLWDDLNPGAAGASEVYYQTLGAAGSQRFVVQWETAHYGGDANDLIRVQAMFDEATGQINVCYVDTLSVANVGNNGAEATAGIQASAMDGFDYSCNTPDLTNGTLLLYIPN